MIEVSGFVRLQKVKESLARWVRKRIIDYLENEVTEELRFFAWVPVSDAAARDLVISAVKEGRLSLWASSDGGKPVPLSSSIMINERRAGSRFRVRSTQTELGRDGRRVQRVYSFEIIDSSHWVEGLVKDSANLLEERTQRSASGSIWNDVFKRLKLPVDINTVPLINWADGTVDLSFRKSAMELNEECFGLYDRATGSGYSFPVEMSRYYHSRVTKNTASLEVLNGYSIFVREAEWQVVERLLDGKLGRDEFERGSVSIHRRILEAWGDNPGISKGQIKDWYFPELSVRRFNIFWAMASEGNPALSKPGPKS